MKCEAAIPAVPTLLVSIRDKGDQHIKQHVERTPEGMVDDASHENDGTTKSPLVVTKILQRSPEEGQSPGPEKREDKPTHETNSNAILQPQCHVVVQTADTTFDLSAPVSDAPQGKGGHLLPVGGINDKDAWLQEVGNLSTMPVGRIDDIAEHKGAAHSQYSTTNADAL